MSQVAPKVWFYWTAFLCDPTRPTSLEPSCCDVITWQPPRLPRRSAFFRNSAGSLLQGMTSSGHGVRRLAPSRWCHTPCSNDRKPSMRSSSCQIFDSRRPRFAPSEARSLGSLALRKEWMRKHSITKYRGRKLDGFKGHEVWMEVSELVELNKTYNLCILNKCYYIVLKYL